MASHATAETTESGVHEVVRRWTPDGDTRAATVLVHGLGEHSGRYEAAGDRFAAAGFSVTAPDLVGFGGSGGRRAWVEEWPDLLDQIQAHVERAAVPGAPIILWGNSMGGLLALEYALAERPAPHLLILSAPGLAGGAVWQRLGAEVLDRIAPRLQIPNGFRGDQLSRDPSVGGAYFSDPLVHESTTARFGAEMFRAMRRTMEAIGGLSTPTLVLHGASDTIVPPQASAPLADLDLVDRKVYPALRHELFNEPEGPSILDEVVTWIEGHLD